ncbi:MAG: LacI family transcriptional regulator [Microbacteriaceae bacterium]|nr:MAG: LacI family transcriptional regulator [Microbacteriaceae bacterium]
MGTSSRRPTLADVARLAGTSTAVVSYVVNGGPRPVATATRLKVQKAIDDLDYRRNPIAGALMVGRSNLVGLLVPDSSNAFFSEMSRHIEQEGKARGLLTLLGNTAYDPAAEAEYELAFSDLLPRGIFVTSIDSSLQADGAATKIYLHSRPPQSDAPSVLFDDLECGMLATDHLLGHGLTDIHCVSGLDDFGPSGQRKRGWERALAAAGISPVGKLHRAPYDRLEAEIIVRELLQSGSPPQGIFATTDEQALAIVRAATVIGLKVPHELAIVGCDGIREALYGGNRLTTIALPIKELAIRAFEVLDTWGRSDSVTHHVLSGRLVVGETCGCP